MGEDPPPKIPNRLSLIHEDDTSVASSVVKTARATRPALTSVAKHPSETTTINAAKHPRMGGPSRSQQQSNYLRGETEVARQPPEQHDGKAFVK